MLIILDGPLGVGKSALAEDISAEILRRYPDHTVEIRRPGLPMVHPLDAYLLPLLTYRPGSPRQPTSHHIVCDGWHWGEAVYSEVFGRPSNLTTPVFHYIELFLASRGAHVVSLVKDAVDLTDLASVRGYGSPASSEIAVMRTITGFMGISTLSTLGPEEMHVETEDLASAIVSKARAKETIATPLTSLATYVGPSTVDTLVLGNVRGPGIRHELAPAFMPYPSTCGEYLMEALATSELGTPRPLSPGTGIANAWDVDSLEEIVHTVMPTRIVALGKRAFHAALKHHPRVCEVGHPRRMRTLWGTGNCLGWSQVIRHTVRELDRSHQTP